MVGNVLVNIVLKMQFIDDQERSHNLLMTKNDYIFIDDQERSHTERSPCCFSALPVAALQQHISFCLGRSPSASPEVRY